MRMLIAVAGALTVGLLAGSLAGDAQAPIQMQAVAPRFAFTSANPAAQTGNATGTLKMNGLGAAAAPCTITPTVTGRVLFLISGNVTNSIILDGVQLLLAYGTGVAPANAAAVTGTAIGSTQAPAMAVAAQNQGFSIQSNATGLAIGTAVWFDLQISDITGGTASVSNVTCTALEL